MDIESHLRAHRKELVIAAEGVITEAVAKAAHPRDLPDKAQLHRLVAICSEASCAEEIVSYLRYQASRKSAPWPRTFADAVIAKIRDPLQQMIAGLTSASEAACDRARVAAWRLYAVFLARAFTYAQQVRDDKRGRP
jgi:hypothetical protein